MICAELLGHDIKRHIVTRHFVLGREVELLEQLRRDRDRTTRPDLTERAIFGRVPIHLHWLAHTVLV
jgi:hypothetical protein